jgi:hypothetical protein
MTNLNEAIREGERRASTSALLTFRDQTGRLWEAAAVIGPLTSGALAVPLHESEDIRFTVSQVKVVRP